MSTLRRAVAAAVATAVIAGLASAVAPDQASAATNGISIGVFPDFPTRVDVGASNVAASVNLINGSMGAEAAGSLTVTELTLVPSCGNFTPTCAGGADPGVLQLSARGSGAVGTACAGDSFDLTVIDSATGRVRIVASDGSALLLGAPAIENDLDTCRIRFTFSALKTPSIDSYPTLGELQTNQVGLMSVRHGNGSTAVDQGEDVATLVGGVTTPPVDPRYGQWADRVHRDLLGRAPSSSESEAWVDALVGGQKTRADLAQVMVGSTDFHRVMVDRDFRAYLNRSATTAELNFHLDKISDGWTFEYSEAYVVASDDFYARHGSTLIGYVEALYRLILGLAPDPAGVLYLVDLLRRGASRLWIAVAFTTWPVAHDRLVVATTQSLLRRPATPAEVTMWSDKLDRGLRQEQLFASLVASDEYWSKV